MTDLNAANAMAQVGGLAYALIILWVGDLGFKFVGLVLISVLTFLWCSLSAE